MKTKLIHEFHIFPGWQRELHVRRDFLLHLHLFVLQAAGKNNEGRLAHQMREFLYYLAQR